MTLPFALSPCPLTRLRRPDERRRVLSMEWLVTADGRCLRLTTTQALLVDLSATCEDLALAAEDLRDAIAASRTLVADSRRWRRMRQSGLRAVVAEGGRG